MTRARWIWAASVAAIAFVPFVPVLQADFVDWDDGVNIISNPKYRGLGSDNLRWMFSTTLGGHYHPLTWLSFGMDFTLYGMEPGGYHFTNVVLHSLAAALCFLTILALLRSDTTEVYLAAALGALSWAIHPLRVESVAWVTERRDVLSGVFWLLTILSYVRYREGAYAGRWYALSIVAFGLSLLSKAWGITIPVVLLLIDFLPPRRDDWRRAILEKLPYAVLAAIAAGAAFMAQRSATAMLDLAQMSVSSRLAQSSYGLCFYIVKSLAPINLSPLYLVDKTLSLSHPFGLVCAGGVIAAMVACVRYRRRVPALLIAAACYTVIVSPVLGLVQSGPQRAADRYSYLSCIPWSAAIAAGAAHLLVSRANRRKEIVGGAAIVLVALASLSMKQTAVWMNSLSLWAHAVKLEPGNYAAISNHAGALKNARRFPEAVEEYTRSLRLSPYYDKSLSGRGAARYAMGDLRGALVDLDACLKHHPRFGAALQQRGLTKIALHDAAGALIDLDLAVQLNPEAPDIRSDRGIARRDKGDVEGSISDFNEALRMDTGAAHVYLTQRALAHVQKGVWGAALADFNAALLFDSKYVPALKQRGMLHYQAGDNAKAVVDFSGALLIDPGDVWARANRGAARGRLGYVREGLEDLDGVVRRDPGVASHHINRGILLNALGRYEDAVRDYERALQLEPQLPQRSQILEVIAELRRQLEPK